MVSLSSIKEQTMDHPVHVVRITLASVGLTLQYLQNLHLQYLHLHLHYPYLQYRQIKYDHSGKMEKNQVCKTNFLVHFTAVF